MKYIVSCAVKQSVSVESGEAKNGRTFGSVMVVSSALEASDSSPYTPKKNTMAEPGAHCLPNFLFALLWRTCGWKHLLKYIANCNEVGRLEVAKLGLVTLSYKSKHRLRQTVSLVLGRTLLAG
jgi:hypothetical protein